MKKTKINNFIPAYLSDFAVEKNDLFSRCKLKIFFIGETQDHRIFSQDFAEQLLESLPYTPVVSRYDEETKDFEGHASKQNIYGIADPKSEVTFEKDDEGVTWAICDVVLYTGRRDVGPIAQKIVGKAHSLELDPKSIEYKINFDSQRKLKNIEFLKGKLIGLSVLGDKQTPAFKGSAFFEANPDFEDKLRLLKNYCESGEEMDVNQDTLNFMQLSWGEKSEKIVRELYKLYECCYIVDFYDDNVIVRVYYPETGDCFLTRVYYSMDENGDVSFHDAEQVRVVYERVEEPANMEVQLEDCGCGDKEDEKEKENLECGPEEDDKQEEEKKEEESFEQSNEEPSIDPPVEESIETNAEPKFEAQEKQPAEEAPQADEAIDEQVEDSGCSSCVFDEDSVPEGDNNNEDFESNSTSLDNSEREELENLKKEKKEGLISSYEESLSGDFIEELRSKIDELEADEIELALAREYKKAQEQKASRKTRQFSFNYEDKVSSKATKAERLAELVEQYKNK